MPIDLNNAPPQREIGELIPDGTIAPVHMTVRPGNAGDGGWLKRSKAGDSTSVDAEFTIIEGPFAKRKFWTLFLVEGVTEGHAKAAEISHSRLRAIVESARGIMPDDQSETARSARQIEYGDLDGVRFVAKVGIEKAKEGSGFKDKNVLDLALTPDRKAWTRLDQIKQASTAPQAIPLSQQGGVNVKPGAKKPSWAS